MTAQKTPATGIPIDLLLQRMLVLAPLIGVADAETVADSRGAGALLSEVARAVQRDGSRRAVWLTLAVFTGTFPSADEVIATTRELALAEPALAHRALLAAGLRAPRGFSRLEVPVEIVRDAVVVDVDFCARHLHNTGIQRVVRQTMARWSRDHDPVLVGWEQHGLAMRILNDDERARVVDWRHASGGKVSTPEPTRIVVPVDSVVVIPEVPVYPYCEPLAALAQFSGNRVSMIGYDAIPILSADTVPQEETNRFGAYLTIVKHAHRIAGISASAAEEFAGFVDTLGAQGLAGPTTSSVLLPVDTPDREVIPPARSSGAPVVLCVGSQEPRKNHFAVLFAAEALWREGIEFSLRFIGGGSTWFTRIFDARVRALRRAGRPVTVERGVDDDTLLAAYGEAAFTVFPSYHEGYGLPVAESLALGVPVITTSYGSTAEIARGGGCLLIDPRDDGSLTAAMRSLLTDPAARARLVAQIAQRPDRTWDDYATELWADLVEGVRA